jgi:radical SAM superfamily enzyme YgiQ (UPF0313 family)
MKVFLAYPPGRVFQRGEDRCQANVDASPTMATRAPIDMMYVASILKPRGVECRFVDYPNEKRGWEGYRRDIRDFRPDALVISTTTGTIMNDLEAFRIAKEIDPKIVTIAKGAVFFVTPKRIFQSRKEFRVMDIAIRGETEFTIGEIFDNLDRPERVEGVLYWRGRSLIDSGTPQWGDLDKLPLPDRSIARNSLYIRPDTGEPQTTIEVSRGCPGRCIYCMTPVISGKRIRYRSVNSIVDEMDDSVKNYGISNFFFRSDTFTFNKKLVIDVSEEIIRRGLKVQWVANSRVDTVDEEMLRVMKRSGCWLIAFGFETGSDESKKRIGKFTTMERDREVVELCRKHKIMIYGFFMIGFPWERMGDIKMTIDHMFALDCDLVELHIATPFYGTELYRMAEDEKLLGDAEIFGSDYFEEPPVGTKHISIERLIRIRNSTLKR